MQRAVGLWLEFSVRRAGLVLVLVALSVASSLYYSAAHFRMNSDNTRLVYQAAPFRQHYRDFTRAFPSYDETTLIVLTAQTRSAAADAADRMAWALRERPDLVRTVYVPGGGSFFEDRALLYLDLPDLERVAERLARAQPVLAALARDPSLRGLFDELGTAIDHRSGAGAASGGLSDGLADAARRVAEMGESLLAGEATPTSWENEFLGAPDGSAYRIVIVQGRADFSEKIASERLMREIRELAEREALTPDQGIRVRLTGMVPLAYEELLSARQSVGLAAAISVALLALLMLVGVRSLRVIVATLATVGVSIAWTSAFALFSVGEFNTISLAFSVLLIGLGVDFAIHLCLRYLEFLEAGHAPGAALRSAGTEMAGPLSLCALTSSIGFLSFVPTDYTGLGELGIISGSGMLFALLSSFSTAPALLALMGPPRGRPPITAFAARLPALVDRHARSIGWSALLVFALALGVATRMSFDFSTLGTKDPRSESMRTLFDLQAEGVLTDYAATILAPDLEAAEELARRLEALAPVAEVRPPQYYLPHDQEEKLEILEDIEFLLGPALWVSPERPPPSDAERLQAIDRLREKLASTSTADVGDAEGAALARLGAVLDQIRARPDPQRTARELETLAIADLGERIDWLRRALGVRAASFADLPAPLRRRLIAQDGRALVSALPREDVSQVRALSRFLDAVSTEAPDATGRPAVEQGIGRIVVRAFGEAIALAAIGILAVVALALRNAGDTLLVLAPLALSAVLTVSAGVVLEMPFNMANVIVIPLVLGLGVDNGIHILTRFRREGSLAATLGSSTPRAVVLSGLTTLGAFGALSSSSHRGIQSMGVLLCLALVFLLVSTLVVLPALLAWRERGPSAR